MFGGKTVHLALSLVFYSSLTVFGQWSTATSGTTNNLNGGYLLASHSRLTTVTAPISNLSNG
jgi:hypothetical protein